MAASLGGCFMAARCEFLRFGSSMRVSASWQLGSGVCLMAARTRCLVHGSLSRCLFHGSLNCVAALR
eukprot:1490397-Alexandrium_andersonii.AAC.1